MSGEVNVKSILALEEQIREHEKVLINLKCARNALLNISTLPPEILGNIFQCNVTLKDEFDWLEEGSRNFLLVCHHWHEVALRTPEVWSFWGDTLADWARCHRYSGTAPLDLVLGPHYADDDSSNDDGGGGRPFDVALHETLQDHAVRDMIRRIHLSSKDASLSRSIISSLVTVCEGVRSNSVESIVLVDGREDSEPMDISDFFARYRFPKLQHLKINGCIIASWDLLASRTAILTTLSLHFDDPTSTPTTSQVLSILASNPTLRKVQLSGDAIPHDGGGESPLRVSLHYLKELELMGDLQGVLGLLYRLDHPAKMDHLQIILSDCAVTDIPQTIGPYLRDHFRRRGRSRNELAIGVAQFGDHITLDAGDMCGTGSTHWFLRVVVHVDRASSGPLEGGVLDLIAHTPQDDIVELAIGGVSVSSVFPESKIGEDEEVLPSIQRIFLSNQAGGDWSPFTAYLARRAFSGDRLSSLRIHSSHVCPEVEERIRSMVQVLHGSNSGEPCPFCTRPE